MLNFLWLVFATTTVTSKFINIDKKSANSILSRSKRQGWFSSNFEEECAEEEICEPEEYLEWAENQDGKIRQKIQNTDFQTYFKTQYQECVGVKFPRCHENLKPVKTLLNNILPICKELSEDEGKVDNNAKVKTVAGWVQGTIHDNSMNFYGIPYAEAPIGDNRWKKPETKKPWGDSPNNIFDAKKTMGEVVGCLETQQLQYAKAVDSKTLKTESQADYISEDCLFLNLVTPKHSELKKRGKRPVLVYIHGAKFEHSTGSNDLFTGNTLANEEGVIVITFNYRLGVFGSLAVDETERNDINDAPGNQGLWDILKVLEWVQLNICNFYGDPDNVTIMGESSGAHFVASLLAISPELKYTKWFHRAIMISNPWMVLSRELSGPGQKPSKGQADYIGSKLLEALSCKDISCAKGKSSQEILAAVEQQNCAKSGISYLDNNDERTFKATSTISNWVEIIDHDLRDKQNFDAFKTVVDRKQDIDIITGFNSGEGATFILAMVEAILGQKNSFEESEESYKFFLGLVVKQHLPKVLKQYPYPCYKGNPYGANCRSDTTIGQILTDYMFICPTYYLSSQLKKHGDRKGKFYQFLFDHAVPDLTILPDNEMIRKLCSVSSCHGSPLPYIFGSFRHDKIERDEDRDAYPNINQEDWKLSHKMRKYFGNFMWWGNPNFSRRPDKVAIKNQDGVMGILGNCWDDIDSKSCFPLSNDNDFYVHHFKVENPPANFSITTVEATKDTCQFWNDLDVWKEI